MLIEFFAWWYGRGWLEAIKEAQALIKAVQYSFSLPVLLKTLFSPWKRIVTIPGRSIDEKMQALLDNLVSRTVGFFVRLFAIFTSLILTALTIFVGVVITFLWPLIPLLVVICMYKGLGG